jgi:hypothetical protein
VIQPQSRFGAIYVTARERDRTIDSSRELLIVAVARARNTGMKLSPDGALVLGRGEPPIRMEPVQARFTIRKAGTPQVLVLDHDGRPTGKTVPVENGSFSIDGARDHTPYYLVRYGAD